MQGIRSLVLTVSTVYHSSWNGLVQQADPTMRSNDKDTIFMDVVLLINDRV